MGEYYTYQKKRREYGKFCNFADTEVSVHGFDFDAESSKKRGWEYKKRDPNFITFDNVPELSEQLINTERVKTQEKGMQHKEGGWPQQVDATEVGETSRYKKRVEKEANFNSSVKELKYKTEVCLKQNNQIDLFEEYFENEESEHFVENINTKTLMLFKDQQTDGVKRAVSEISWHPEHPVKVAVGYSVTRFQQMTDKMSLKSFVWDLNNPNKPEIELNAPSPCTNIAYNHKLTDIIGGGLYNGLVAIWDVRTSKKGGCAPVISPVQKSHHDPVTHLLWQNSKTGSELVTSSTDGTVLFWDFRKMSEGPVDSIQLTELFQEGENKFERPVGGTVVEYNAESGANKFLVGTEQGSILTVNRKPKKALEITTRYGQEGGKHLGPIYSINRSLPNLRYFLSVGDWNAKIWNEELKTPIIRTKYHGSYLSDGCFSPIRPGVFFLVRKDGWLDVWDYYYRQNEVAFTHKVSDTALTCIKLNYHVNNHPATGKYCAIGDQDGTVTLIELCDSLYQMQPREKDIITEMFERESKKEKMLEQMKKLMEKKNQVREKETNRQNDEEKKQAMINKWEEEFYKVVGDDLDNKEDEDLDKYGKGSVVPPKPEEVLPVLKAQVQKVTGLEGEAPVVVSVCHGDKTHSSGALVPVEGVVKAEMAVEWTYQEGKPVVVRVMQEGKQEIGSLEYSLPKDHKQAEEDKPLVLNQPSENNVHVFFKLNVQ